MNLSLIFIRIFFGILTIFFMTAYMMGMAFTPTNAIVGITLGVLLIAMLIGFDILFKRFNLRSFNIVIIGLFIGYLVLIFNAILGFSSMPHFFSLPIIEMIKIALFLFGTYLGTIMMLRFSDEFYISIPFVKFSATKDKKKDLILDLSSLYDPRLIDLCSSGLVDHQVVLPRFLLKELYALVEAENEINKAKARKCIEVVKNLEEIPHFGLRYNDTDFPEITNFTNKLLRLARLIDANILTTELNQEHGDHVDEIRLINIHKLANTLKPIMQTGEIIKIKVQRYGKGIGQGVGYLEDGTMVVINGGGDYIGKTTSVQVISVKHTLTGTGPGRMIFCNALEEGEEEETSYIEENDYFEE